MKIIKSFIGSAKQIDGSKSEEISRILEGQKWNIVDYRRTNYSAFTVISESHGDNVG